MRQDKERHDKAFAIFEKRLKEYFVAGYSKSAGLPTNLSKIGKQVTVEAEIRTENNIFIDDK